MENSESVLLGLAAAIGSASLSFCGYFLYKNVCSSKTENKQNSNLALHVDVVAYNNLLKEVNNERDQMILRLKKISERNSSSKVQMQQVNIARLFAEKKASIDVLREKAEASELTNRFLDLPNEYPRFSIERAKAELHYVPNLYIELSEHHSKVKILAEEYFRRVEQAQYLKGESINFSPV